MVQKLKTVKLYNGDIPKGLKLGKTIAIDTETMGLNIHHDRLCLVQISDEYGNCHLIKFEKNKYNAPNLKELLKNKSILKIFHFARFDMAVIKKNIKVECEPIYCTKIASKLARTFTDKHGLKELCKNLLGVDINKQNQSSDWGQEKLTMLLVMFYICIKLKKNLIKF